MPEKSFEHEHVQTNKRVMSNDSHHKRNLMVEDFNQIILYYNIIIQIENALAPQRKLKKLFLNNGTYHKSRR